MIEKYIRITYLLDQIGPFSPRLDSIQDIIQSPDFKYQKEAFPEVLMDTLAQSSYWLHHELFDESYLYRKDFENLSGMQQIHLKMLDIGAALMDKGFPFQYDAKKYNFSGKSEFASYAKSFIEQCHKRRDHLKNSQKLSRIPVPQKTKE